MSQQFFVLVVLVGLLMLPGWFFERRIGGASGGSEANIVGVLWFVGSLLLGLYLVYGRS